VAAQWLAGADGDGGTVRVGIFLVISGIITLLGVAFGRKGKERIAAVIAE